MRELLEAGDGVGLEEADWGRSAMFPGEGRGAVGRPFRLPRKLVLPLETASIWITPSDDINNQEG